jgi:hypothetical protein
MFVIEDEAHAEPQGEFETFDDALAQLRLRAAIPWDHEPNRAPCTSWRTCGRRYEVVEYDARQTLRRELDRVLVLEVSATGVRWEPSPEPGGLGRG